MTHQYPYEKIMDTIISVKNVKGGYIGKLSFFIEKLGVDLGPDEFLKYLRNGMTSEMLKDYKPPKIIKPRVTKRKKLSFRNKCATITGRIRKENNLLSHIHIDHIIPLSFCKKIGITPDQACINENLRFISAEENICKWSFLTDDSMPKLIELCSLWRVPIPEREFIQEHNLMAGRSFSGVVKRINSFYVHERST